MRKLNNNYNVSYTLMSKNKIITNKYKTTCYSILFSQFKEKDSIILEDFNCEETLKYSKSYIVKLCRTFNFKYKFINKNEVKISNILSKDHLKIFLTLFRILFEVYSTTENNKIKNVKFIKSFIENTYKIKDLMKRICHCYNESKIWQGSAHGLKNSSSDILVLKTKKDLMKYKGSPYNTVHNFFK